LNIKIDIDIKNLEKALKNNAIKILEAGAEGLLMAGEKIATDTKLNTPVDTGRLRGSYNAQLIEKNENEAIVEVGTDVEYAGFVEFGTSRQQAQPHFMPAVEDNKKNITKFINKKIKEALK